MLTIEELKLLLKDRNIAQVSRETGLHANVIYRVVNGHSKPSYDTIVALSNYINKDTGTN